MLAETVPTARLVGVVKHGAAEGTLVPLFQLLHKPVLSVVLEVQGNGVAGILADETTGGASLLLRISHSGGQGDRRKTERAHTQTTPAPGVLLPEHPPQGHSAMTLWPP